MQTDDMEPVTGEQQRAVECGFDKHSISFRRAFLLKFAELQCENFPIIILVVLTYSTKDHKMFELLPSVPVEMKLALCFFLGIIAICEIANRMVFGRRDEES